MCENVPEVRMINMYMDHRDNLDDALNSQTGSNVYCRYSSQVYDYADDVRNPSVILEELPKFDKAIVLHNGLDKATSNEVQSTRKPTPSMNLASSKGKEKMAQVDEVCVQHETKKANSKDKEKRRVFQRMFICLGVCKEGFKVGYKLVIGLYGCHLKSPYGGQLLLAIGIDANNMTWVIVYAQVEMETKDSCIWFFQLLVKDIELILCKTHIHKFSLVYKGKMLKDEMWRVAFATTVLEFRRAMEVLRTLDGEAHKWLTSDVLRTL
ncbi:PREDICTED: LOC110722588 [Prunus dulcis]|uniref:PREDICTED: LOC110722588 n=1 Tax=Prunus dulcis TaxID=3755 RepID=A0A5E4GKW2_PRUDU|nr:PREDICTED: LOC110722588 [Prunus dulcis]VVA40444.1 PREDICTED: LOC110722588 [Prunus dulcis]